MRRRPRNILEAQKQSRVALVDAVRRHAFLAAVPSQLVEVDAGTITNRAGVEQRLTVFIRVEAIPVDPRGLPPGLRMDDR